MIDIVRNIKETASIVKTLATGGYFRNSGETLDVIATVLSERMDPRTKEIRLAGSTVTLGSNRDHRDDVDLLVIREGAHGDLTVEMAWGKRGTAIDIFRTTPQGVRIAIGVDSEFIQSLTGDNSRVIYLRRE